MTTSDPQARTKQIASIATAIAISISVYLITRHRTKAAEAPPPPHAVAAPGSAAPPPAPSATPRVRKAADRAEVDALRTAIRKLADARQHPRATSTSTTATPAPTLPPGDLAKDYIQASVKELIPLLAECYEQGLEKNPTLAGTITVSFTIEGEPGAGGVIGESTILADKSDLPDPAVRACIQETMYAIQIDPPSSGGVMRVNYPFVFKP